MMRKNWMTKKSEGKHNSASNHRKSKYGSEGSYIKRAVCILTALVMAVAVSGCGGDISGGGQISDAGAASDGVLAGEQSQGNNTASSGGQTAMGRYVEEEIDLSGQLSQPIAMRMLTDGSIVILDTYEGMLVSKDQGATWNEETPDWLADLIEGGGYINSMAMTPNGTVVVSYDESVSVDDYKPTAKMFLADGTEVPIEIELTEDDTYVRQVVTSDEGRIFAVTYAKVYEIYEDGSSEVAWESEYVSYSSWIWVKDNLMFIDSDWDGNVFDRPLIYDPDAGEYVEDSVFKDFTQENYAGRRYNGRYSGSMFLMPGDDETIYVMGSKGIHRHVVGGNMMEQIVDGSLSLLSTPNYSIVSMLQLEEESFLALFANHKLIRFTYDPNVPSVPENMITIYSLREDSNIRQAISLYQTRNPDTFVSYEIGMSEGDAVTRADAVKKLNTEIMAGTGPDLIVMDDLPIGSYVEKGLLLDLTDYTARYSESSPLFDNVIDAMKYDSKVYMVPASVSMPVIATNGIYTEKMTDVAAVGEAVEKLREEHPGENIIGLCSPGSIMKRFAAASAPKWAAADGTIDSESIGEYLEQCKRIYDAQMDGLDADIIRYYTERSERMAAYDGIDEYMMNEQVFLEIYNYVCREEYLLAGWMSGSYDYLEVMSLDKAKGFEDTKVIPMRGQCSNVFMPGTILGINAMSDQVEAARGFVDVFLSADAQSAYSGFALNREALDMQFTPVQDYLQEDGGYMSWASSDAEGNIVSYRQYWPSDEQIAAFKSQLASLNTAYIPDSVLEKAVFDGGTAYLRGEKTLQQALDAIDRTVALYMAE